LLHLKLLIKQMIQICLNLHMRDFEKLRLELKITDRAGK
jgi:hypothetical protein